MQRFSLHISRLSEVVYTYDPALGQPGEAPAYSYPGFGKISDAGVFRDCAGTGVEMNRKKGMATPDRGVAVFADGYR